MTTGPVATSLGIGKRLVALSLIITLMVPPKPARAVLPVVGVLAQYIVPLMIASVVTAVIAQRDAANGRPMGKALDSAISGTLANMGKVASAIEGTWTYGMAKLGAFSDGKTVEAQKGDRKVVLSQNSDGVVQIAEPTSPPEMYEVPAAPDRPDFAYLWHIDAYGGALNHGGRVYQSPSCAAFTSSLCRMVQPFSGLGMRTEGGAYYKDTGDVLVFFDNIEQIRAFEIDRLRYRNSMESGVALPIDVRVADGPYHDRITVSGALNTDRIGTSEWMILFDEKVQPSLSRHEREESHFGKLAREAPLTDESIANIVDSMWRASGTYDDNSQDRSSVAYSATRPVTADEVRGWRESNPSLVPSIYDIANVARPNREASVIVSPRAEDYARNIPGDVTGTNYPANTGDRTNTSTGVGTGSVVGTNTGTSTGTAEGTKTDTRTGLGENVNVVNQPDVRVVNPVRIDMGAAPEASKPGLEATPTARSILLPVLDMLPGFDSWRTPPHSAECPRPAFDVFNTQITMDAPCDIAEQHRSGIHSVMLAVFAIAALFIILSA